MATSESSRDGMDTDLYALLHVSQEATEEEIKRAYRQWAQVYHPDKHQNPQMQDAATRNFQRIRYAYDVLSDEQQRQIYDLYGLEGLKSGLELGPRLRTRDEIRADFERAKRRKAEARLRQHTSQMGSLTVNLSIVEMLRSYQSTPTITGMQASQQVQARLSESNLAVLGGNMVASKGAGGGNFFGVYRHTMSPLQSWEILAMGGLRSLASFSTTRQLSSKSSGTMAVTIDFRDLTVSLSNGWTRQLSSTTSGSITILQGTDEGVAVGLSRRGERTSMEGELKVGENTLGLVGSCSRRLSQKTTARVQARLSTQGMDVEIGATRKMSEHSTVGFSTVVGLQGVIWKVRFSRGTQKFTIPIIISSELRLSVALPALLGPPAMYALLKYFLLKPYATRRRRRKESALRDTHSEKVKEARAAAEEAQGLLAAPARRKRAKQEAANGLVITSAVYGNLKSQRDETDPDTPPPHLDVLLPLLFLTDDSGALLLHEGIRKDGLMGFCDPCPGEEKQLRVSYTLQGELYQVTVRDYEELRIPQSVHRVDTSSRSDSDASPHQP